MQNTVLKDRKKIYNVLNNYLMMDIFVPPIIGLTMQYSMQYIPAEVSQMIGAAFTISNASDYDDMFIASKDETMLLVLRILAYQIVRSVPHRSRALSLTQNPAQEKRKWQGRGAEHLSQVISDIA